MDCSRTLVATVTACCMMAVAIVFEDPPNDRWHLYNEITQLFNNEYQTDVIIIDWYRYPYLCMLSPLNICS